MTPPLDSIYWYLPTRCSAAIIYGLTQIHPLTNEKERSRSYTRSSARPTKVSTLQQQKGTLRYAIYSVTKNNKKLGALGRGSKCPGSVSLERRRFYTTKI